MAVLIQHATKIVPHLRLALAALLVGVALAASLHGESRGAVSALDRPTAVSTYWTMNMIGLPAHLDKTTLTHPAGFALRIGFTCTVLIPALIIAAFLLALPMRVSSAALGIAVGILLLSGLNSLRLAGLYYVGVYSPEYFGLAHDWFGQALIAASIVAFLACWTRQTGSSQRYVQVAND